MKLKNPGNYLANRTSSALSVALVTALTGCPERPDSAPTNSGPIPLQSSVQGPFANEPVNSPTLVAAVPTQGSSAPLLQGSGNQAQQPVVVPRQNTDEPDEPEAPVAVPTPIPVSPTRDTLIDGLLGRWLTDDPQTARSGGGWVRGGCVLTITTASNAREVCTTRTQYGPNEQDSCNVAGALRTRTTSNPYILSVQNGIVHFTPSDPDPVQDDHCNAAPGQRHTVMDSVGWTGMGGTLRVQNSVPARSDTWESSYRRDIHYNP